MEMVFGPTLGALDDAGFASAYPWPSADRWVRAMMVTSLDGAVAGSDGRSGSISSPADRAVLAEVRRLSDVVLIGASTMRAERYRPMRSRATAIPERIALGLAPAPVLAIVSGSLDLPWHEPVFTESTISPIVVTTRNADPDRLATAREHADVVVLPGDLVDPVELIALLQDRGLTRIVCEGGPRLLAHLAAAGLVDEADISISPLLVGGGQEVTGLALTSPVRFRLRHVIADDGFLFNRYVADSGEPRASALS